MMSGSRRGGAILGILLALTAALIAAAVVFVVNVRVRHDLEGHRIAVETPFGSIRVREDGASVSAHRLGIPLYPGARLRDRSKSASIDLDFGNEHKDLAVAAVEYVTDDSYERVLEFYRSELPKWGMKNNTHMDGCVFILEGDGGKRIVALNRKHGETRIAVASVGQPASN